MDLFPSTIKDSQNKYYDNLNLFQPIKHRSITASALNNKDKVLANLYEYLDMIQGSCVFLPGAFSRGILPTMSEISLIYNLAVIVTGRKRRKT
jgi:hypothetical protein